MAEADGQPKRYSVWRPDGELWRQFFGSLDYSTSVFVDRSEPDYLYAQSVRYKVDYETGSWAPERTILRADAPPATPALLGQQPAASRPFNLPVPSVHGGARIIVAGGRKFLWTWDGWSPGEQALYESIGDRLVPRMALVPVRGSEHGRVWIDDSNDGAVQDQEIRRGLPARWAKPDGRLNWYWHDGVQWHNQGGMKTTQPYRIVRWRFRGFNERGGLVFDDPAKAAVAAEDTDGGAVSDFTVDDDGNVFVLVSGGTLARGQRAQGSGHRIVAFGADGAKRWEYHNVHCAFAWTSSPYAPGFIVGAVHLGRGIGERLLSVTGYYGQYFLLDKRDGLFVDALGEDQRSPYTLDHRMVLTENFNGTLYEHANGKTYFAGGDADARVWELTGLDTLTRFDRRLEVSAAEAEQAMDNARRAVEAQARGVGRKFARLVRLRDAAADGRYGEWIDVARQPIFEGDTRAAAAQLGYDDSHLWIRFSVRDDSPLTNAASDYRLLFKTGDALDIALTTDLRRRSLQSQNRQRMEVGDLRIVVSRHPEGHMLATVMRPKTPGANKPSRFVYRSPVWQEIMDEVVAADHLPMHVEADSEGYVVEIGVPWEVVGATPASGRVLHGDVGVIFGNRGGTRNAVRYMWSDDSPEISVNNDLPSEARLHPNDWGAWFLR